MFGICTQLKLACVGLVAECNLSFNIIRSEAFRELLELSAGRAVNIPSTRDIMKCLSEHSTTLKAALIEKIGKQKYVCLTCDIWSSRAQSYFGMTVHCLNSNFKRESFVLAFRQMNHKQTNKEINLLIRDILRDYKINPKKVTHIVTDGGSSFCKAFKQYGISVDMLVENNLVEDEDQDENQMPFMQFEDGEEFYSNIIDLDAVDYERNNFEFSDGDEFSGDSHQNEEFDEFQLTANDEFSEMLSTSNNATDQATESDEYAVLPLPAQRRCLSHLLNLLGNDFENFLTDKAKECLVLACSKLQALWVFPRKSSQAKTYSKEILGSTLPVPVVTRWNSKYDSVSKVLSLGQEKMNKYITALKTNLKSAAHLSNLDKEDWIMINIYVRVLKPVAITLDRLQGEIDCSQGFILPSLFTMKHQLENLDGGNVLKQCRDAMLKAVDKRFKFFFKVEYSNRELLLASVSTPRFKTDFIERDVDCAIARNLLVSECRVLQMDEEISQNSDCGIDDFESSFPNSSSDDFFVSYSKRDCRRRSIEIVIDEEITRYLADDRKELNILNEYPNIRNVFYLHNTTLSASAAIERVFSQSNMIFTPRRNRLLARNFENLVLLKHNRKRLISK